MCMRKRVCKRKGTNESNRDLSRESIKRGLGVCAFERACTILYENTTANDSIQIPQVAICVALRGELFTRINPAIEQGLGVSQYGSDYTASRSLQIVLLSPPPTPSICLD